MTTLKLNDRVYFGRKNGEKTLGEIIKVNRKTYKVKTLEGRGTKRDYIVGTVWTVPHSMVTPAAEVAEKILSGTKAGLLDFLTDGGKVAKRADAEILRDISNIHCALSPENLHCDGEISRTAARIKGARLRRELRALETELGRSPTDSEIYAY